MQARQIAVAVVLAALGLAGFVEAEEWVSDLLQNVPAGAEVVAVVNVRALTQNPAFDTVYERLDTTKLDAAVVAIDGFTGVHLLEDVEALALAGELKDEGKGAFFVKGTWDKHRLLDLVAMNPSYETQTTGGPPIHLWQDEDTGKMNHAAFLRDDVFVMSEWLPMVQRAVDTAAGKTPSLKSVAASAGTGGTPAPVVVLAFRPSDPERDVVRHAALGRLQSAAFGLRPDADSVTVWAKGEARDAYSAAQLAHVLRGLIALGELHDTGARSFPWEVVSTADGARVEARVRVPLDNAIEAACALQRAAMAKK